MSIQINTVDPKATLRTHLKEMTPQEKLAEWDRRAKASNAKKSEGESNTPHVQLTASEVIEVARVEAIRWIESGYDFKTVTSLDFEKEVCRLANVAPDDEVAPKKVSYEVETVDPNEDEEVEEPSTKEESKVITEDPDEEEKEEKEEKEESPKASPKKMPRKAVKKQNQ